MLWHTMAAKNLAMEDLLLNVRDIANLGGGRKIKLVKPLKEKENLLKEKQKNEAI